MFLDFRALTREVVTEIATWKEREGYIALQGASTKSSTVLVSNQGYSFGVKRKSDATDTIYWRCNKRPKKRHCSATVIKKNYGQVDEEISVGCGKHSHPPTTGLLQDILVQSQVSMTPVIMEHISNWIHLARWRIVPSLSKGWWLLQLILILESSLKARKQDLEHGSQVLGFTPSYSGFHA